MNQPSATELTAEQQAIEDRAAPDTLREELSVKRRKDNKGRESLRDEASILKEIAQQGIDVSFLAFFSRAGLEVSKEDLERLGKLSRGEVQTKGYYFNLLVYDGLFPQRGELTDEECSRFLFMKEEEKPAWEAKLAGIKAQREAQQPRDQLTEVDTRNAADVPPARQHRPRVKSRSSYLSPSREGTIAIAVHLDPDLKEGLDKAVEQSGLTQREYLTALIRHAVKGHSPQADETLDLSKEALMKTHEAEQALRRLTNTLSSRSR